MHVRSLVSAFVLSLATAACGSSTDDGTASATPGNDAGTTGGDAGAPAAKTFRTHLILGDSISDRGGEAPFYYDLLDHNDDARWPEDQGKDFATRFPDLKVVKASKGGAKAINLASQIHNLPTSIEGPILATITIGGNDVQAALGRILTGGDDTALREEFAKDLGDALTELTQPGRFGEGVTVTALLTNIYDPSDGTGNFTVAATGKKCPGALQYWPAGKESAALLDPWEQIMVDVAGAHPGVALLDLRGTFQGHGVAQADSWFVGDCIHPNATGHDRIRDLFWDATTKL